jgi:Ca-activated chloride channel homolog
MNTKSILCRTQQTFKLVALLAVISVPTGCGVQMVAAGAPAPGSGGRNPLAKSFRPPGAIVWPGANKSSLVASDSSHSNDTYANRELNPYQSARKQPLSTFSIDVDTASYANIRRFLNEGSLPPSNAVRIEEMVNYFHYNYPEPKKGEQIAIHTEITKAPWNPAHRLLQIGIKGKTIAAHQTPPRNLVFLLDVSGSMGSPDKLPLVIHGMKRLVDQLNEKDHVSIVVYAGASGVVLEPTAGNDKTTIKQAMARLQAGGSTNGGQGIELAYKMAAKHFQKNAINRVILASDGDFNVGISDIHSLEKLIEDKRKSGVFLSVLGVGRGNLNDATMESIADKGNGNYSYLDSEKEANRVLVENIGGTLITVAKDVKIQVEFNPNFVKEYRLIGYENRMLKTQDFKNDKKDAGELGSGQQVTALYELVPPQAPTTMASSTPLKYKTAVVDVKRNEIVTIKVRHKPIKSDTSLEIQHVVQSSDLGKASAGFTFASSVAALGMILRHSPHRGAATLAMVKALATDSLSSGEFVTERREFISLVSKVEKLSPQSQELAK